MTDPAKRRARGARSKKVWRKKNPEKARARNRNDCHVYYWAHREQILEQRRIRRKRRACADLLAKEKHFQETQYGYRGKLQVYA